MRKFFAVMAAVAAFGGVSAAAAGATTSQASVTTVPPSATFCVDNVTTTLNAPTRAQFPNPLAFLLAQIGYALTYARDVNAATTTGTYQDPPTFVHYHLVPGATHTIGLGACFVPVTPPAVNYVEACVNGDAARADGTSGQYVQEDETQYASGTFTDENGKVWDVSPAYFVQNVGTTCDNPVNSGYHFAGYNVNSSGIVDVDAPQFNLYPLFVK